MSLLGNIMQFESQFSSYKRDLKKKKKRNARVIFFVFIVSIRLLIQNILHSNS